MSPSPILASHNRPPLWIARGGGGYKPLPPKFHRRTDGQAPAKRSLPSSRTAEPRTLPTFAVRISKGSCQSHISDGRSQLSNYVDLPFQGPSPQPLSQVQI